MSQTQSSSWQTFILWISASGAVGLLFVMFAPGQMKGIAFAVLFVGVIAGAVHAASKMGERSE